tara:strand:+ start:4676 stop:4873 length:198 start_codon:yes stop_codon:yes gene_type:complete
MNKFRIRLKADGRYIIEYKFLFILWENTGDSFSYLKDAEEQLTKYVNNIKNARVIKVCIIEKGKR